MILRLLSLFFASLAIPASIFILRKVWEERARILNEIRSTNSLLLLIFAGAGISAIINFLITFVAIIGWGHVSNSVAPYRTLFLNMYLALICWLAVFIYPKSNEH